MMKNTLLALALAAILSGCMHKTIIVPADPPANAPVPEEADDE